MVHASHLVHRLQPARPDLRRRAAGWAGHDRRSGGRIRHLRESPDQGGSLSGRAGSSPTFADAGAAFDSRGRRPTSTSAMSCARRRRRQAGQVLRPRPRTPTSFAGLPSARCAERGCRGLLRVARSIQPRRSHANRKPLARVLFQARPVPNGTVSRGRTTKAAPNGVRTLRSPLESEPCHRRSTFIWHPTQYIRSTRAVWPSLGACPDLRCAECDEPGRAMRS